MTYTVVVIEEHFYIAGQLLPETKMVGRRANRVYLFYRCTFQSPNRVVIAEDGEELVATHSFSTLREATEWANEDARRRVEEGVV